MMRKILEAREIALSDLRSCYRNDGILASQVNFTDYWARDTFWACLGLIESNIDLERVRSSLELFLKYQKTNGKIPRKISLDYNGLKYLGLKIARKKPRPIYTSPIKIFFSMDDNLLLVIVFCEYVRKTKDKEFSEKYFSQIKKALEFYQNSKLVREKLVYEIGLGNWMDTVFKKGFVLYTSCLWYQAVREYEKIVLDFGFGSSALIPKSAEIRAQLQKVFWRKKENYFADSVSKKGKQQKYFDLAGNVLAIIFEVADVKQIELILNKTETIQEEKAKEGNNFFHPTVFPRYPFWKINPVCFPLGIGDYQNGNSWSWIEILLVIAKNKYGRVESAKKDLTSISRVILKNGHLHETYFLDGNPFDHLLWKSAVPFAWSAGLFLYAVKEMEGAENIADECS
jgi:glycogen debranching enzyme